MRFPTLTKKCSTCKAVAIQIFADNLLSIMCVYMNACAYEGHNHLAH